MRKKKSVENRLKTLENSAYNLLIYCNLIPHNLHELTMIKFKNYVNEIRLLCVVDNKELFGMFINYTNFVHY